MLPFIPEPVEKLKERFPKALEKIWIARIEMNDRPGLHREHVFDFENQLRLLISRDKYPTDSYFINNDPVIHISASWEDFRPIDICEYTRIVQEHYSLIGGKGRIRLIGISEKSVPHWIVDDRIQ